MAMFVLIAGGGRTATQLASMLISQDHKVHLIEHRREVLTHLHREIPTELIYEGNPTDPNVLEQAGIEKADVLAACTSCDEDNLVIGYLAKTRYNVPRVIARVNHPKNAWLFDRKFHIDVAVNQAQILSTLIEEEMSLGDMMVLLKLRRGRFALVEERIPPGAFAVGKSIQEIDFPRNSVIAAIIRGGRIVVPRGTTQFEAGDEVLALVASEAAEEFAKLFAPPPSSAHR
jgi:trk system potassium uptake protein TrkA